LRERRVELAERLEAVFSQGQQDARHSLTSRTRSELARIFGKEIGELVDNDGQRKDSQLLKGLLGFNAEKQTYALIPPFMRKYPETNVGPYNMFNPECLMKTLQACLFGPLSLKKEQDPDLALGGKCIARAWDICEMTPGAIAFAAILARYALSPDREFGTFGGISGIDYLTDFAEYKEILIKASRRKSGQELLAFWNNRLFPNRNISTKDGRKSKGASTECKDLLRELEDDDEIEVEDDEAGTTCDRTPTLPIEADDQDFVPADEDEPFEIPSPMAEEELEEQIEDQAEQIEEQGEPVEEQGIGRTDKDFESNMRDLRRKNLGPSSDPEGIPKDSYLQKRQEIEDAIRNTVNEDHTAELLELLYDLDANGEGEEEDELDGISATTQGVTSKVTAMRQRPEMQTRPTVIRERPKSSNPIHSQAIQPPTSVAQKTVTTNASHSAQQHHVGATARKRRLQDQESGTSDSRPVRRCPPTRSTGEREAAAQQLQLQQPRVLRNTKTRQAGSQRR
ncbi:hypothetical protein FRB95_005549, partial [Tulasnella sp. JGI-2019a]